MIHIKNASTDICDLCHQGPTLCKQVQAINEQGDHSYWACVPCLTVLLGQGQSSGVYR